jgi:Flp pilus assembly protein TadG
MMQPLPSKQSSEQNSERGSTLVELALILPIFLLLLLGAVDLGRGFRTYLVLTDAAQTGARWLTTHPSDSNGARALIVAEAAQVGLAANTITITITPAQSVYHAGDTVTVTVEHTYLLMFGALTKIPQVPFRTKAIMRVLYG